MLQNTKLIAVLILVVILGAILVVLKVPTKLGLDLQGGTRLTLQALPSAELKTITPESMDMLQTVLERRVNGLGVGETVVQRIGADRMLVEIPGVTDPEAAKRVLGKTGKLEFEQLDEKTQTWSPTGFSGKDLANAQVMDNGGQWEINFKLNGQSTNGFGDLTTKLVGKPLGIFFDGKLVSAPKVNTPITGGSGVITGSFTLQSAQEMVNLLNAGALPVNIEVIEESTVGPSLGAESIQRSLFAGLVGISLVILFMAAWYRLQGVVADVALIIYALITFAVFKIIPVTLTLAGIAGFILSIGMAVDANVLIFERTKEELKLGRTLGRAIDAGFDRAFTSIFDSNMTTLITCAILYGLGTGMVKGFALTLAIGVLVSMFTAIFVTRTMLRGITAGAGSSVHPGLFGLRATDLPAPKQA